MDAINGVSFNKLDFELSKRGDIISLDGPLLSHFFGSNGRNYLLYWVDCDNASNRWLLFEYSQIDLLDYFNRKKALRELIRESNELVYFIDIDDKIDFKKIIATNKNLIPKSYLPDKDSYFEEFIATKYALQLKKEISEVISRYNISDIKRKFRNFNSHLDDINFISTLHSRNIYISHVGLDHLRASYFPLLILEEHFGHQSKGLKYLLFKHQNAYTNPIEFDSYFYELNSLLSTKIADEPTIVVSFDNEGHDSVLQRLYNVTFKIVSKDPSKFRRYIKLWKNSLKEKDSEIDSDLNTKLEQIPF